jgi:hypothetical protein
MLNRALFALCAAVALTACSDGGATITSASGNTGGNAGGGDPQQASNQIATPQDVLERTADAIKLTGTIVVKDYESGLLQVDVTLPVEGNANPPQGIPPITVARYKTPGPFTLYLPPGTKAVNLSIFLDLKGDGPDARDPKAVYAGNPIKIDGRSVSGIELTVDKTPGALPPTPPPDQSGAGSGSAGAGSGRGIDALSALTAGTGSGSAAPASGTSPAPAAGTSPAPAAGPAAAPAAGTSPAAAPGTAPAAAAATAAAPASPAAAPGSPSTASGSLALTTAKGAPPAPASVAASQPGSVGANPPGVKPVPATSGNSTGKTAVDVLDEALDGAPRAAKDPPKP